MSEEELKCLRDAIGCMYQYNEFWLDERSYNHRARIHTSSCQHGWEQFLPWHRLYLYVDRIWHLWQQKHPGVNPEQLDGYLLNELCANPMEAHRVVSEFQNRKGYVASDRRIIRTLQQMVRNGVLRAVAP